MNNMNMGNMDNRDNMNMNISCNVKQGDGMNISKIDNNKNKQEVSMTNFTTVQIMAQNYDLEKNSIDSFYKKGCYIDGVNSHDTEISFLTVKSSMFNELSVRYPIFEKKLEEVNRTQKRVLKISKNEHFEYSKLEELDELKAKELVDLKELKKLLRSINQDIRRNNGDVEELAEKALKTRASIERIQSKLYAINKEIAYFTRRNNGKLAEATANLSKVEIEYNDMTRKLFKLGVKKLSTLGENLKIKIDNLETFMVYFYQSAIKLKGTFNNFTDESYRNFFMRMNKYVTFILTTNDDYYRQEMGNEMVAYLNTLMNITHINEDSGKVVKFWDMIKKGHDDIIVYAQYMKIIIELAYNTPSVHCYMNRMFSNVPTNPNMNEQVSFYLNNKKSEIEKILCEKSEQDRGRELVLNNQIYNFITDVFTDEEVTVEHGSSILVDRKAVHTDKNGEHKVYETIAFNTTLKYINDSRLYLDTEMMSEMYNSILNIDGCVVTNIVKDYKHNITVGYANLINSLCTLSMNDERFTNIDLKGESAFEFMAANYFGINVTFEAGWIPEKTFKNDWGRIIQKFSSIFGSSITMYKGKIKDPNDFRNNKRFIAMVDINEAGIKFITDMYENHINGNNILSTEDDMAMMYIIRNFYPKFVGLHKYNVLPNRLETCKANINYNNGNVIIGDYFANLFFLKCQSNITHNFKFNEPNKGTTTSLKLNDQKSKDFVLNILNDVLTFNNNVNTEQMIRYATIVNDEYLVPKEMDGPSLLITKDTLNNTSAIKMAAAQGATNIKSVGVIFDIEYELKNPESKTTIESRLYTLFGNTKKVAKVMELINNHDFDNTDLMICNGTSIKDKDGVYYTKEWLYYVTDSYHKVDESFEVNKGVIGYVPQYILNIMYPYLKMSKMGRIETMTGIKSIIGVPHFNEDLKDTCIVSPKMWAKIKVKLSKHPLKSSKIGDREVTPEDVKLLLVAYPKSMRDRFMKVVVDENATHDILFPYYGMNWVARDFDGDNMYVIAMFDEHIKTDEFGFTDGHNNYSNDEKLDAYFNDIIERNYNNDVLQVQKRIKFLFDTFKRESVTPIADAVVTETSIEYPKEFLESKELGLFTYNEVCARVLGAYEDSETLERKYQNNSCSIWTFGKDVNELNAQEINLVVGTIAHELLLGRGVVDNFNRVGEIMKYAIKQKFAINQVKDVKNIKIHEEFKDLDIYFGNHILYSGANEKLIKGEKKPVKYLDVLSAIHATKIFFDKE